MAFGRSFPSLLSFVTLIAWLFCSQRLMAAESSAIASSMFYHCFKPGTDFETVRSSPEFTPLHGLKNLGYMADHDCWSRIVLTATTEDSSRIFIEASQGATFDTVEYFHLSQGFLIKRGILGFMHPFKEREVSYRLPTIPIVLAAGENEVYIRITSRDVIALLWKIHEGDAFYHTVMDEQLFFGGFLAICFALALYNLAIFFASRDFLHLLYCCYISSYALSQMFLIGIGSQYLEPIVGDLYSQGLGLATISLGLLLALGFVYLFLDVHEYPKSFRIIFASFAIPMLGSLLANGAGHYALAGQLSLASSGFGSLIIAILGAIALFRKHPMAVYFLVSWGCLMVGNALQVLMVAGVLTPTKMITAAPYLGATLEAILISYALAQKMKIEKFRAISAINQQLLDVQKEHIESLDRKVAEKTRDIRSILDSVQQSLFTISGQNLKIDDEASSEFQSMFRTGNNPPTFLREIFSSSSLSAEHIQMMESALLCTIGEDIVNFEVNQESFPKAFSRFPGLPDMRHYEVDWNPIQNQEGLAEKVLVSIRDVTEMRRLAEETLVLDRELVVIRNILAIPHDRFPRSIKALLRLCHEIEELTGCLLDGNREVIRMMFISLHTLKGNTRTLGLVELSEKVHAAEDLLKEYQAALDDNARLQSFHDQFKEVSAHIHFMEKVAREKLGRQVFPDELTLKHSEMEEVLLPAGQSLQDGDKPASKAILKLIDFLYQRRYLALSTACSDIIASLEKMAKNSAKILPKLEWTERGPQFFVSDEIHDDLTSALMHLMTNALDHGLEKSAERQVLGKDPQGTIRFDVRSDRDSVRISMSDDGRGLNLPRVRALGIEKGLIDGSETDPHRIALAIFQPGFSTADQVSQTSGRGVGMDAVRGLLEGLGGRIELSFHSTNPGISQFEPFSLNLILPRSRFIELKNSFDAPTYCAAS